MNDARRKRIKALLESFDIGPLQSIAGALDDLRDEEQESFDNLPESLQDGERGAVMQDCIDKLQAAADSILSAIESVEEAEGLLQEVS